MPNPQGWKVQADPEWAGKHPYHDCRYVTTSHFDFKEEGSEGSIICKMTDHQHQRQYAHLIAAAPDLLEALEGLFEQCVMVHKYWGDGDNSKLSNAAQAEARAAIAKAKQGERKPNA